MKTKKILSRCHETEVEWTPEPLSPMMLRKSIRVLGMSVKPKPKPEKKPAKWVKDGYVVPMQWSTQERRARRQWLRDNGEILTAKERNSRFPQQMKP